MGSDNALKLDPLDMALGVVWAQNAHLAGQTTTMAQTTITAESVDKWHAVYLRKFLPLCAQAENESVGARREALWILRLCTSAQYLPIAGSEKASAMMYHFLRSASACSRVFSLAGEVVTR